MLNRREACQAEPNLSNSRFELGRGGSRVVLGRAGVQSRSGRKRAAESRVVQSGRGASRLTSATALAVAAAAVLIAIVAVTTARWKCGVVRRLVYVSILVQVSRGINNEAGSGPAARSS